MNFQLQSGSNTTLQVTFSEIGAGLQLADGRYIGGQVAGLLRKGEQPAPLTFTVMEGELPESGEGIVGTSTGAAGIPVTWAAGTPITLHVKDQALTAAHIAYAAFGGYGLIACHDLFEDPE